MCFDIDPRGPLLPYTIQPRFQTAVEGIHVRVELDWSNVQRSVQAETFQLRMPFNSLARLHSSDCCGIFMGVWLCTAV